MQNKQKIKFTNEKLVEELRSIIIKYQQTINKQIDQIEQINLNVHLDFTEKISDKIKDYNLVIDSWFDQQYKDDINKLLNNISNEDLNFNNYERMDFITINYND